MTEKEFLHWGGTHRRRVWFMRACVLFQPFSLPFVCSSKTPSHAFCVPRFALVRLPLFLLCFLAAVSFTSILILHSPSPLFLFGSSRQALFAGGARCLRESTHAKRFFPLTELSSVPDSSVWSTRGRLLGSPSGL